ncbi:MAG TPA: tetratricopeptide repeat protein [Armatimonadota bacterium]|jgi:uncharacterized protein (TIGR02996 family)|nr:tetratricopeptide repeat protein [Armatimonadota bacterium]
MLENLFLGLAMGTIGAAYLAVGAYLFHKAILGDITFREAVIAFVPLVVSFIGVFVGQGTLFSWICGLAGLGYLGYLVARRHQEERQIEIDLVNAELEKWGRAVADDDANAGAHLYLANALVEKGDFDAAATHYRKSLERDPTNIKELMEFLLRRPRPVQAAIRERLPELDRLVQDQYERDTYGRVVTGPNAQPLLSAREPEPEPAPEGATAAPPAPVLLGYESPEEAYADQQRRAYLSEMRRVVDQSPDDVAARLAYAAALEEAGHPDRAREEYRRVLSLSPDHAEARAALNRLGG